MTGQRLAAELDTADLLLRSIAVLRLPGMDPADRMQLAHGLTVARRAIAGALSPARRDLSAQARVAVATPGGPVRTTRLQPGECLSPGSVAAVAAAVTESAAAVVAGSAGDNSGREGKVTAATVSSRPVQHRAGRPPLPGAVPDLMEALKASLPRPNAFAITVGGEGGS